MKLEMKSDFNARDKAQTLSILSTGDTTVRFTNENTEASVVEKIGPKAYTVATPKNTLQRNRNPLRAMPQM